MTVTGARVAEIVYQAASDPDSIASAVAEHSDELEQFAALAVKVGAELVRIIREHDGEPLTLAEIVSIARTGGTEFAALVLDGLSTAGLRASLRTALDLLEYAYCGDPAWRERVDLIIEPARRGRR